MSLAARLILAILRAYQRGLSPLLGPSCRYHPTCSHYMVQAVRRHGALRGVWLGLTRLLRCHPWGGQGLDPVPAELPPRWWLGRQHQPPPATADTPAPSHDENDHNA